MSRKRKHGSKLPKDVSPELCQKWGGKTTNFARVIAFAKPWDHILRFMWEKLEDYCWICENCKAYPSSALGIQFRAPHFAYHAFASIFHLCWPKLTMNWFGERLSGQNCCLEWIRWIPFQMKIRKVTIATITNMRIMTRTTIMRVLTIMEQRAKVSARMKSCWGLDE